jgi:alanine racemase
MDGGGPPDRIRRSSLEPLTPHTAKLLRPTWAEISLAALGRNFERVRRLAGPRKLMAVVKADAYGHGAVPVARVLAARGVDWLGVATVEEAVELREAGVRQPILLLGGLYMSDPADLIAYDLTPGVSSTARLDIYAECARRYQRPINFHLKIDTGLGRLGLPPDLLDPFVAHLREICSASGEPELRLTGLFTHLASAEDLVASQTAEQGARFAASLARLRQLGIDPEWIHVSNSAALLAQSRFPENLVRIGALLYGTCLPLRLPLGTPAPGPPEVEPILSFKSRVVYLKDVPSGTPLGYGASHFTRRPSRIATLPVGYADGLSRALSNRGRAMVRGRCASIVGSISMDLTLLDVTDIPGVAVGDEVILIGKSDEISITALEISRELGTVPYEVLCSIGKRVPRVYLGD